MLSTHITLPWAGCLALIGCLCSCTTTKTSYVSDAREPNDLPPSPRYSVVWMALRDELPRHGKNGEFYLPRTGAGGGVAAGFARVHAAACFRNVHGPGEGLARPFLEPPAL